MLNKPGTFVMVPFTDHDETDETGAKRAKASSTSTGVEVAARWGNDDKLTLRLNYHDFPGQDVTRVAAVYIVWREERLAEEERTPCVTFCIPPAPQEASTGAKSKQLSVKVAPWKIVTKYKWLVRTRTWRFDGVVLSAKLSELPEVLVHKWRCVEIDTIKQLIRNNVETTVLEQAKLDYCGVLLKRMEDEEEEKCKQDPTGRWQQLSSELRTGADNARVKVNEARARIAGYAKTVADLCAACGVDAAVLDLDGSSLDEATVKSLKSCGRAACDWVHKKADFMGMMHDSLLMEILQSARSHA